MDNTQRMLDAGLTEADITNCKLRFNESGFDDYNAWCVAYTMLHSEQKLEGRHNATIDLIPKKGKSIFKVSKNRYKA
jgi:hypothetical protein